MANHSSATLRNGTPHVTKESRTNTIFNALKRRAQAVLNDESIDPQTRAVIRYAMEKNDPWLAEVVRRTDAGERSIDALNFSQTSETNHANSTKKIEALADIICGAGDQSAAALLVLMSIFENSTEPEVLSHTAKHFAFTRCGELNVFGLVDAQIAMVEDELLAGTLAS